MAIDELIHGQNKVWIYTFHTKITQTVHASISLAKAARLNWATN
jgi:hypothetical protein